jgi:hypothetical protein
MGMTAEEHTIADIKLVPTLLGFELTIFRDGIAKLGRQSTEFTVFGCPGGDVLSFDVSATNA